MLLTLPAEVVDAVIENVDNPGDLAALSAVCKNLKLRISPASGKELGLLQCCYLSVHVENEDVFSALAATPKLARAVRRLRLPSLREHQRYYWCEDSARGTATNHRTTSIIRYALRQMHSLQFLSFDLEIFPEQLDWSLLFDDLQTYCPNLKEAALSIHGPFRTPHPNDAATMPMIHKLNGLQGLSVELNTWMSLTPEASENFAQSLSTTLVQSAASLLHLDLSLRPSTSADTLAVVLPSLVSLSLNSHKDEENCPGVAGFLLRHPGIRYLKMYSSQPIGPHEDILPHLREVSIDAWKPWFLCRLLSEMSNGHRRPLRRVSLFTVWDETYLPKLFAELRMHSTLMGVNISHKVLQNESYMEQLADATAKPGLQEIHFTSFDTEPQELREDTIKYVEVLLDLFPSLRSLQNFCSRKKPREHIESELLRLGSLSSKLICVDDWVREEGNTWKMDRNTSRVWKWVLPETESMDQNSRAEPTVPRLDYDQA